MSLIINMLKDLEKRQGSDKILPPIASITRKSSLNFYPDLNTKIVFIVCAAILMIAATATVFKIAKIKLVTNISIPAYKNTQNQTPFVETTGPVTITNIENIEIQSKESSTSIIITLNQSPLYEIRTDDLSRQIVITFDNAKFLTDIPAFDNQISQIEGVRLESSQSNLIVSLKKDAILESITLIDSDKNPKLILNINTQNTIPNNPDTIHTIKKPALSSIIINQYKTALRAADVGNTKQAITQLSSLLKQYPDYDDVRVSLAALLIENKQTLKAESLINEGLILSPDYIPLIKLKAHILTAQGKMKEALLLLQREQPLITDYPDYHAFIAALYSQEDNYQLAANIYKKLVKIDPHQGSWWFGLGVSLDKMGNNKDAVFAYTKAATEGNINTKALSFLQSRLQVLQGEPNAAE